MEFFGYFQSKEAKIKRLSLRMPSEEVDKGGAVDISMSLKIRATSVIDVVGERMDLVKLVTYFRTRRE